MAKLSIPWLLISSLCFILITKIYSSEYDGDAYDEGPPQAGDERGEFGELDGGRNGGFYGYEYDGDVYDEGPPQGGGERGRFGYLDGRRNGGFYGHGSKDWNLGGSRPGNGRQGGRRGGNDYGQYYNHGMGERRGHGERGGEPGGKDSGMGGGPRQKNRETEVSH